MYNEYLSPMSYNISEPDSTAAANKHDGTYILSNIIVAICVAGGTQQNI